MQSPKSPVIRHVMYPVGVPHPDSGKKVQTRKKFSYEEDMLLKHLVETYGPDNWSAVSKRMPSRSTRQCRERWKNYLNPDVKSGAFTDAEDELLMKKVEEFGSQWSLIAKFFPGRTQVSVKNRWVTRKFKNKILLAHKDNTGQEQQQEPQNPEKSTNTQREISQGDIISLQPQNNTTNQQIQITQSVVFVPAFPMAPKDRMKYMTQYICHPETQITPAMPLPNIHKV